MSRLRPELLRNFLSVDRASKKVRARPRASSRATWAPPRGGPPGGTGAGRLRAFRRRVRDRRRAGAGAAPAPSCPLASPPSALRARAGRAGGTCRRGGRGGRARRRARGLVALRLCGCTGDGQPGDPEGERLPSVSVRGCRRDSALLIKSKHVQTEELPRGADLRTASPPGWTESEPRGRPGSLPFVGVNASRVILLFVCVWDSVV